MKRKHTCSELGETVAVNDLTIGCKNFARVLNLDDCGPEFEQNTRELASSNYRTHDDKNEYLAVLLYSYCATAHIFMISKDVLWEGLELGPRGQVNRHGNRRTHCVQLSSPLCILCTLCTVAAIGEPSVHSRLTVLDCVQRRRTQGAL